jgi:hypothetical protein
LVAETEEHLADAATDGDAEQGTAHTPPGSDQWVVDTEGLTQRAGDHPGGRAALNGRASDHPGGPDVTH